MVEISVIVPVYNVEDYLAKCLESVISQTFEDIEILCVNDGSTDNSAKILEKYAEFDKRIKIFTEENEGISSARNCALNHVKGKYIFYVDPDDYISTNALEQLHNKAIKNNADLVLYDFIQGGEDAKTGKHLTIFELKDYLNSVFNIDIIGAGMYKNIPFTAWSKLYKWDLVKDIRFNEGMVYEDLPYWAYVFTHAKRIAYINKPYYYYFIFRGGSIMNALGERVCDVVKSYNMVEKIFKDAGYWESCKYNMQLLRILDYTRKFRLVKPEFRELFFNTIKQTGVEIDPEYYKGKDYYPIDYEAIEKFKNFNKMNFDEFCKHFYGDGR